MNLPKELVDQITQFCIKSNFGFAQIVDPNFSVIIIGNAELSPDQVSILGAHALLGGVIESKWNESQAELIGKKNLESLN